MGDVQLESENWLKKYSENFPLPPPDDNEATATGWTLIIKEFQNFSLSSELKATPDTSSFGFFAYISVFNRETGLFHGRTWKSPLITKESSNFIDLAAHGILLGNECVFVIEFSLLITYYGHETTESSLFFTVIPQPSGNGERPCPLYTGTPRLLLSRPKDFQTLVTVRPGTLIVELNRNDDLLKAEGMLPFCTFVSHPVPGVKSLSPVVMESLVPITITKMSLEPDLNFEEKLSEELSVVIAGKYGVNPSNINLRIIRKGIHLSAHNTHKFVWAILNAELIAFDRQWKFDGRITIRKFLKDPNFAIVLELFVTVELDLDFLKDVDLLIYNGAKGRQTMQVPLGFAIIVPQKDSSMVVDLSRVARSSPFGMRLFRTTLPVPKLSITFSYSQVTPDETDTSSIPMEFRPLLDENRIPLALLQGTTVEPPQLAVEEGDPLNVNNILIVMKYIVPKPVMEIRFPLKHFRHVFVCLDLWPNGIVRTKTCSLAQAQESVLCFVEDHQPSKTVKGTILCASVTLKTREDVVNFFLALKDSEIQAQLIDAESSLVIGSFSVPTISLLRQTRRSLQFATHSNLVANDGELLGTVYFSCGNYGTVNGSIMDVDFEFRHSGESNIEVSLPMVDTNEAFREYIKTRPESTYELATKYRDGIKKTVIVSDLQKRFLRSRSISPVPGIESRFVFTSAYEPDSDVVVIVNINDERLRLLRVLRDNLDIAYAEPYMLTRHYTDAFAVGKDIPLEERMHLAKVPDNKFVAKGGNVIQLLFAFFTLNDFESTEISVSLTNQEGNMLDCFSVFVNRSAPVVHETTKISVPIGQPISTSVHTMGTCKMAIASAKDLVCHATSFGLRLSSEPVNNSFQSLLFMYDGESRLTRVIRLHVSVVTDQLVESGGQVNLNLSRCIGKIICCKTSDTRVAEFITNSDPSLLADPGKVIVRAISPGIAELTIWNVSDTTLATEMILRVGDSTVRKDLQKLWTRELTLKVGETLRRIIKYKNTKNQPRTVRVSTSHPALVEFDPTHYDIGPLETVKIGVIFRQNLTTEDVVVNAYVQDTSGLSGPNEFFKFILHYVQE